MGALKRIKGWFTKNAAPIELDKTSNINAIGVARNVDLKKINNKIIEIENTLNNLPPPITPPDLSPYALKAENNEFLQPQTIKNNAAFVEFKDGAGSRKGYIGKPTSTNNDLELKAETNSLKLSANHNIILTTGDNYNVLLDKQPTANNHITNKQYVDTKIRQEIDAIPSINLSDFASLSEANTFAGINQFNGDTKYLGNVTDAKNIATKEYVDNNSVTRSFVESFNVYNLYKSQSLSIEKRDLSQNLWYYIINAQRVTFTIPTWMERNAEYEVTVYMTSVLLPNTSSTYKYTNICIGSYTIRINNAGEGTFNLDSVPFIYHWDLKIGATGQTKITCGMQLFIRRARGYNVKALI